MIFLLLAIFQFNFLLLFKLVKTRRLYASLVSAQWSSNTRNCLVLTCD